MVAIDTEGNIYQSLSHANTDAKTFRLFLHRLIGKLQQEDHHWRQNTVVVMDGASYHKAESTCEYLGKQGVQTVVPVSYTHLTLPTKRIV